MNKNIIIGSLFVSFFCVGGLTGYLITDLTSEDHESLLLDFQDLDEEYNNLLDDYNTLLGNYSDLQSNYEIISGEYESLNETYYSLLTEYVFLNETYNELVINYNSIVESFNALQIAYDQLDDLYSQLLIAYAVIESEYNALLQQYYLLTTWISEMTLPAQYMVFAEAVRRYYFEDFYVKDTWATGNESGYFAEYARFSRDVVLHDSQIFGSWFSEVSNALADCLKFGNVTTYLAWYTFYYTFYDWIPNWGGYGLSGKELNDIDSIVQWCIDEIDYEYDTEITIGQDFYYWDYIKFPVETAFRTKGDCEDQALLCAAYLESCGFETALGLFHDPENPISPDGFYHATLLVHIEDVSNFEFWHPFIPMWSLGGIDPYTGYSWVWVDPTWDVSFPSKPGWMQYYLNNGITDDDLTIVLCDINGATSYNP